VDNSITDEIAGKAYRIIHCKGAKEALEDALMHVEARKQAAIFTLSNESLCAAIAGVPKGLKTLGLSAITFIRITRS
jgi:hypothetical protein